MLNPALAYANTKKPLKFGLLPHLSSNLLIKKYNKLIVYLENRLQRKIIVKTAPDFKTYVQRSISGEYDVYLTAPHFAAHHKIRHQHRPLTRFARELSGVFAVGKNTSYKNISDLRGKTITMPDPLAIISMLGIVTLEDNDLYVGKNITVINTQSHNNAILTMASGRSDASISGNAAYNISQRKNKKPIRILAKTNSVPQMMFMTPARLPKQESDVIKEALLNFSANGAGKAFFIEAPFNDMIPVSQQDINRLKIFIPKLDNSLKI